METFTKPGELVENKGFEEQRRRALSQLTDDMIDAPILDIVRAFNALSFCFTLQSCYGHFVYEGQDDVNSFEPLPADPVDGKIEYRIAYIAFCIDNSMQGWNFMKLLQAVTKRDPDNIQFGSADWFWERQVNSFAVQVEPERFSRQDTALLDFEEAARIEDVRGRFFEDLRALLVSG